MGRRVYAARVDVETPPKLQEIARRFGYLYMAKDGQLEPTVGMLLDRIADGTLRVEEA